jgi:AraC-like DNA-binding protein
MCRHMKSINRQSAGQPLFGTLRRSYPRGTRLGLHAHHEAQLIFAVSGTMQVHTETGRWLVPPQLAVWAPARLPHALDMLAPVEMWSVYYDAQACRDWAPGRSLDRAFALRVTPLLRALIVTLFETAADSDKAELIVRLILHELTASPDAPTFLPMPASPVGKRVADLTLADPAARLDMDELARRAATSARTISRLFPTETGLTFKAWRQRARIVAAIDGLSTGASVREVAAGAGFASTAAFSFAFRQVTGMTAGSFLDESKTR